MLTPIQGDATMFFVNARHFAAKGCAVNRSTRTVLFDLDGTLLFHEPDSFDVISAFCADIGQPLDPEAERQGRRLRHKYFVDPVIREELSGLSQEGFWRHFNRYLLEAIGLQGDLQLMADQATARFADVDLVYRCPEAGCHTLVELRARGYGLGLITNRENVDRFHQLLDDMELRSHFDVALASGELGVSKPEPGIFAAALERLGAEAGESLYVGDNYWADVLGARRAGITPVLLDPHELFPEADCLVLARIDELLRELP
jgi:putative hydrolase of the HAD superfamily